MFEIKRTGPRERETLARWVAATNLAPEDQIGYLGDDPAEVESSLLNDLPVLDNSVFVHSEDGDVGFLGFEELADSDLVLLYGPLVKASDWDSAADALFTALTPLLPKEPKRLELFFNEKNVRVESFARRNDFEPGPEVYLQRFTRDALSRVESVTLPELDEADYAELLALQDTLFPNRGGNITKALGEHEKIFVLKKNGKIAGYTHVTVNPKFPEGYVEYVAVNPEFRGQRIGDQLMAAALHWMFSFDHIQETWLTTYMDNVTAQKLYAHHGFETIHTMHSARKVHAPDPA
jgi:ribosomal protein S18 acetylase RimI-like enzyme